MRLKSLPKIPRDRRRAQMETTHAEARIITKSFLQCHSNRLHCALHCVMLDTTEQSVGLVIPMVVNIVSIVVGLLFIFSVNAVSQESENSEKNANELARFILQNEVKAE